MEVRPLTILSAPIRLAERVLPRDCVLSQSIAPPKSQEFNIALLSCLSGKKNRTRTRSAALNLAELFTTLLTSLLLVLSI